MQDIATVDKDKNSVYGRNTLITGQLISSQYYKTCEVNKLYDFSGIFNICSTIGTIWCLSL